MPSGIHLLKHGYLVAGKKPLEYSPWCAMRRRCYDSNFRDYPYYGGRGITVYQPWRESFPAFLAHMGPRPDKNHTLERLENDLGYFPGNVIWGSRKDQSRNTRCTRRIDFNGKLQGISDWADELGLPVNTIRSRLFSYGWSVERAFTTPIRGKRA